MNFVTDYILKIRQSYWGSLHDWVIGTKKTF